MNIGLILAAGVDPTFQMDIPKQFVSIDNRPVMVYTLEVFQKHPEIDKLVISCLPGWEEMVRAYAKQFNITKLLEIVSGGYNAQESIRRGVEYLEKVCQPEDIVVVHDAIRPLVSNELISDSVRVCRKMGMGVAAVRSMDTIMVTEDGTVGRESISRYNIRRIQTPQAYQLSYLGNMHRRALQENVVECVDNNSMIAQLGETIYFSKGSDFNIKINTVEDVAMFKALYAMQQSEKEHKRN